MCLFSSEITGVKRCTNKKEHYGTTSVGRLFKRLIRIILVVEVINIHIDSSILVSTIQRQLFTIVRMLE